MNIAPINNTNPNFNGKVINKGIWTEYLLKTFNGNPEVIKLASGKNDIIAKMSRKFAKKNDLNHFAGEEIYKLTLKSLPENPSLLDKIKSWFNPATKVTRTYHSELGMERLIKERMDANRFAKKLNIEI